jgi:hypothetical protein
MEILSFIFLAWIMGWATASQHFVRGEPVTYPNVESENIFICQTTHLILMKNAYLTKRRAMNFMHEQRIELHSAITRILFGDGAV